MSKWLHRGVTLAWLAVLGVAAFSAGAASEGAAQWLWPVVVMVSALAQMAFNHVQQRRRQRDQEWLRAIVDAVPYPLFYRGSDSQCLGINDAFSKTFGVDRSAVIEKSTSRFFGSELQGRGSAQDWVSLASGEPGTSEESRRIDGQWRTFEVRKTPFYDGEGVLLGIVGVAVDVTVDRQQQRDLKETNLRLQETLSLLQQSRIDFDLALQAGDLGVWRTEFSNDDLERNVENLADTLVEWDAATRRIAGLPDSGPLTKRDILRVVHADDRYRLWSAIVEALRIGGGRLADFGRIVRPDGSVRTVAIRAAVTYWASADGTGVARGLTGIIRDVTDEEEIKSELKRKVKEAQDAEQSKSRFLAMMSHEIRTPLNGIIGMLELVMMKDLDDDERRMLEGVKESAFVLLAILNDILDFSKIEAGQLEVENVPYRLSDVVESIGATWSAKAFRKGITLKVIVDPDVPACVLGDRVRLYQVLTNLIGNAIKFTERGGVAIRVSVVAQEAGEGADCVRFDVEDTGIGIDVASQARLFEPFQQADVSTTRNYGGTGLGLSIVKSLVEAMGGRVHCASALGVGSRFSVVLPLARSAGVSDVGSSSTLYGRAALATLGRESEERAGRLILVAEDNAMNREVIARQLSHLGYCCDMAEDGEDAWARLRSGTRYGLLLVDGHMPKLDGYQLVERIRSHERASGSDRLRVVAVTANALAGERDRCLSLGMDDCLAKPLLIGELDRVLRRYVPSREASLDQMRVASVEASSASFAPLRALVNDDAHQFAQLVLVFEKVASEDLVALGKAVQSGEWEAVRNLAHRMKSTFGQAGDVATARTFAILEHATDRDMQQHSRQLLEEARSQAAVTIALAKTILMG